MSFVLPVDRVRETKTLIAFRHPKPAHSFRLLIVPKKAIPTLTDLDPNDPAFLTDLFSTIQSWAVEFHWTAYRVVVNAGDYPDLPQLHFHLISDVVHPP
ncbi:MAG TPA: HIT domain-containing protein [Anaerolineales bacterium]|nr:HIT domain-containing protein [Anaerolineales bacterium]